MKNPTMDEIPNSLCKIVWKGKVTTDYVQLLGENLTVGCCAYYVKHITHYSKTRAKYLVSDGVEDLEFILERISY